MKQVWHIHLTLQYVPCSIFPVNIHSHLVGAVLFIFPVANFQSRYMYQYESSTWLDTIVFAVFLSSAVFCLTASAFYHTFSCHSELVSSDPSNIVVGMTFRLLSGSKPLPRTRLYRNNQCVCWIASIQFSLNLWKLSVLIVGSFYPCIYYGFFCETHFQVLYLAMITLAGAGQSFHSQIHSHCDKKLPRCIVHSLESGIPQVKSPRGTNKSLYCARIMRCWTHVTHLYHTRFWQIDLGYGVRMDRRFRFSVYRRCGSIVRPKSILCRSQD